MRKTDVAIVAVFSALVIGTDFALAPFASFKLLDTVVFMVAFVYGFRQGAAVAVVSEAVWSVVSPWGAAGAITPFLVGGELLFALAGWGASRVWRTGGASPYPVAVFIGATLAICAFVWDFAANAMTALIWFGPGLSLAQLLTVELAGFVFPVPMAHELADFALGMFLAPASLLIMPRLRKIT
ncbi:MAG: hypothetical protein KGI26_00315 [Thaumarchaeota archaeon]|nr:hypothetical protein [Nitrososphaerota archaeon]